MASTVTASVAEVTEVKPPNDISTWKAAYARQVASKKINEEFEYFQKVFQQPHHPELPEATEFALNPDEDGLFNGRKAVTKLPPDSKVCIIGAGMSGLYIAMILDYLQIENLSYEILEASDRVGGRVYTHYFSNSKEKKHDYYDVGAMRFPNIPIMKKTFALFDYLKEDVPLMPYYMDSPRDDPDPKKLNQPSRYNDITILGNGPEPKTDQFKVSDKHKGRIMAEIAEEPEKYVTEMFEPFKDRLRKNWKQGFNTLMKYDEFSVRQFMMAHGIIYLDDYYSIQWLETLTDGSGLYDQGFSEGVIDSLDFDYYTSYIDSSIKVDWFCVDGGTQLVPDAMNAMLKKPLRDADLGKRVTKIAYNRGEKTNAPMSVKFNDEKEARKYMTVFATPTLACLQRIDLTGLELLYEQKDAIRSLHYDTASKVGMKFKRAWWIEMGIEGGLGKTDMPLRTCVYPSYNLGDPTGQEAVLLCSYSWAQDAARMGSLMKGDWKKEGELKQVMLNNLTWLHLESARVARKNPTLTFDDLYEELDGLYIEHHAFDWHNHEFSSGAYGKFGPGQFSNLYSALTCPTADSRFHIVGEAASSHHGWIVGALDSAHQAVLNFLRRFNLFEYEVKLKECPFIGPEPDELDKETAEKKVVLGLMEPDVRMEARMAVENGKSVAEAVAGNGNGVAK